MARKHYHVVENTPGYLPESDPATFGTLKAASDYALSLKNEVLDQNAWSEDTDPKYKVSGTKTTGYYITDGSPYDLGRVIDIIPCTDEHG